MTICAMRGNSACSTSPKIPSRVATRTGFSTQACTTIAAASAGISSGMLS